MKSSANSRTGERTASGRSLMNARKRRMLRTGPCGTPKSTGSVHFYPRRGVVVPESVMM